MRLIATDLDGALLNSATAVSARTRRALDAARDRGVHIVPVTARQPIGFDEWALCDNSAFGIHLTDGQMRFA